MNMRYKMLKLLTNQYHESIFSDLSQLSVRMKECLADDLNSSAALAIFFDFIRGINSKISALEKMGKTLTKADLELLKSEWPQFKHWMKQVLGLLKEPQEFFEELKQFSLASEISINEINIKLEERKLAQKQRLGKI